MYDIATAPKIVCTPEHEYYVEGIHKPGVNKVLQTALVYNTSFFDEASRERGNNVHRACELWNLDNLDEASLHQSLVGYLGAWQAFVADNDLKPLQVGPELLAIELMLYSPMFGFCGKPDAVMVGPGGIWVPDIKSGAAHFTAAYASAAYSILVEENLLTHGRKVHKRGCVLVSAEGKYKWKPYADPMDKPNFLHCLSVYNLKVKHNIIKEK
jgi:hypothetical protein